MKDDLMGPLAGSPPSHRRRRRQQGGQAIVELALIAPIFFGAIFFTLGALFYIGQAVTVVHAAHLGGRIAAAGAGTGPAASVSDWAAIRGEVDPLLRPALLGAQVTYYVNQTPAPVGMRAPCPDPASMTEPGRVAVCASVVRGIVSGTPVVSVHIYGRLASLLPGFPALRVNEQSVLPFLGFQP
jgi:Flp pilus assembly protein TadG